MSQCVPNWDLDDGLPHPPQIHPSTSTTNSNHAHMSDYVASEPTWANGSLPRNCPHGGAVRVGKPVPKRPSPATMTWGKPLVSGTLEAVVDQAARAQAFDPSATAVHRPPSSTRCHLVPWLGSPLLPVPTAVDALVPSAESHRHDGEEHRTSSHLVRGSAARAGGGGGTCVGSSCGGRKRARLGAGDGSSVTVSAAHSAGSIELLDTCETNGGGGEDLAASASPLDGLPETANTTCGRTPTTVSDDSDDSGDDRPSQDGSDEEERSKNEKRVSSISTKRSMAADVHNQSERVSTEQPQKRRDRINQRMRTLQKLLPSSTKTDKASILDDVISYMKQLQAQLQMMSRMNAGAVPHMMMMPMALQQLQMAMMTQVAQMAQMGMAMGMGMVDVNTFDGAGQAGMPWPGFFPSAMLPRDVQGRDQLQAPGGTPLPDPSAAFVACQSQPIAVDAYRRMAALYQQLHQQPPGSTHHNT